MYKINGKYLFTNAGVPKNDYPDRPNSYDVNAAVSDSVYGPYTALYRAIPFAGHNSLFQDGDGNWWSTFFGTDHFAPWGCKPGILPVTIDKEDNLKPKVIVTPATWSYTVQDPGVADWYKIDHADSTWAKGQPGFGNPGVMAFGELTVVNTPLPNLKSIWMRTEFEVSANLQHPAFYLRASGPVKIYLNGEIAADIPAPSGKYQTVALARPALLQPGHNIIAMEGTNAAPLAYFDVGVVDVLAP